jgi:hypothetical protein
MQGSCHTCSFAAFACRRTPICPDYPFTIHRYLSNQVTPAGTNRHIHGDTEQSLSGVACCMQLPADPTGQFLGQLLLLLLL